MHDRPPHLLIALIVSLAMLALIDRANGEVPTTLPVWPGAAPGEPSGTGAEHLEAVNPKNPVNRITDVTVPTLAFYPRQPTRTPAQPSSFVRAARTKFWRSTSKGPRLPTGSIPSGSTQSSSNIACRSGAACPRISRRCRTLSAVSLVRKNASDWKIDSHRVGMLGFSAGGNLAARVSTNYEQRAYPPIDDVDKISCRPDFAVLIYPAWLVNEKKDGLIADLKVTPQTPPMFIVQTTDDPVDPESSVFMYLALKRAKVSTELHIFSKGGHGYGLRPSDNPVHTWPARCADWMASMKLLG